MTSEEARALIDATEADYSQKQRILRGLQILAKYDDNLEFAFEHDQVYVGNFDKTVVQMSREEIVELAQCGWFPAEESWSHF